MNGKIINITNKFVVVEEENTKQIVRCNLKGKFKKENITFLVGDNVTFELEDNIFKDKQQVYQKEQENVENMKLIEYVEYIPIHKRIMNKVIDFFKNILRR